jgi:hypothetical protein
VLFIEYFTTPQHIVRQDQTIHVHTIDHQIEVSRIIFLVRIDKHQIKGIAYFRNNNGCITDPVVNPILQIRFQKILSHTILELLIYIDGNEFTFFG